MESSQSNIELFLKISVYLTGFDEADLQGTGMLDIYYQTLEKYSTPQNSRYFFEKVNQITTENTSIETSIVCYLMPISAYDGVAQKIITMWYTGSWNNIPVTAEAYVQSLVWKTAQTHPPGAKQPGYGSWSIPPL